MVFSKCQISNKTNLWYKNLNNLIEKVLHMCYHIYYYITLEVMTLQVESSDKNKNSQREDKILHIVWTIATMLWFNSKIVAFERANIINWKLDSWDFFSAVHSEKEWTSTWDRWYIIRTEDWWRIFIWYSESVKPDGYHFFSVAEIIWKNPEILELIQDIRNIEWQYRKLRWIRESSGDWVHRLIGLSD